MVSKQSWERAQLWSVAALVARREEGRDNMVLPYDCRWFRAGRILLAADATDKVSKVQVMPIHSASIANQKRSETHDRCHCIQMAEAGMCIWWKVVAPCSEEASGEGEIQSAPNLMMV